ncbi:MAG: hypothetical protein Q8N23_19215 [Archangium sp.]|nr:hypothetical protein [Archangium sp.]MDP3154817.1 hypothetical protein [Archangium sp.]MDP3575047.1 hypothetical protein [Archangium sp.]
MRSFFFAAVFVLTAGCGASMPGNAADSGANVDDAGTAEGMDAGRDAGAGAVDAGPVMPGAPVLTSVSVVTHGTMAINWQLPASGCSTLALRMKVGAGAYSTVRSLTGVATSTQYSPGHANGTYCYQLTCTLQGLESAASNERCATQ